MHSCFGSLVVGLHLLAADFLHFLTSQYLSVLCTVQGSNKFKLVNSTLLDIMTDHDIRAAGVNAAFETFAEWLCVCGY
jgi:hypothetical protein